MTEDITRAVTPKNLNKFKVDVWQQGETYHQWEHKALILTYDFCQSPKEFKLLEYKDRFLIVKFTEKDYASIIDLRVIYTFITIGKDLDDIINNNSFVVENYIDRDMFEFKPK
jgi:hypothetical protein